LTFRGISRSSPRRGARAWSAPGYEGDPDRVTVLFEEAGYRTLALGAVREHGLLEPVG
jgi:hypothetical protein